MHVEGVLGFSGTHERLAENLIASAGLSLDHGHYLNKTQEYLNTWLDLYYLSLHPIPANTACLFYPIPNPGTQCVKPIDEPDLSTLALAYELLSGELPDDIKAKMFRFMRNMAVSDLSDIEMRCSWAEAMLVLRSNHYLYTDWHSHGIKLPNNPCPSHRNFLNRRPNLEPPWFAGSSRLRKASRSMASRCALRAGIHGFEHFRRFFHGTIAAGDRA